LAINIGFTAHPLNARAESQRGNFQHQSITGVTGAKTASLIPVKDELLIAIGNFTQSRWAPHCARASITKRRASPEPGKWH